MRIALFHTQPKQCASFPGHRFNIPPKVPLTKDGDAVGGERWVAWRTGCLHSGWRSRA